MKDGTLSWRQLFSEQLRLVEEKYPPRLETDINDLADMLSSCLEGGIILSRILKSPEALSKQVIHYRNYLRLLYGNE